MNLCHKNTGRDHVELDVDQEGAEDLVQGLPSAVRELLAPHEGCLGGVSRLSLRIFLGVADLELGELVSLELLPDQDEPDHVLGEKSEGSKVEHLIAMIIYKLQYLRWQG